MRKEFFVFLLFWIFPAITSSAIEKKVSVHNDGNFDILLSFKIMESSKIYDQMLTIRSGNTILYSFLIEQIDEELFYITGLSSSSFECHSLRFKPDSADSSYNICFSFDQLDKKCILQTTCDTLVFTKVFVAVTNITLVAYPSSDNIAVKRLEVIESVVHYKKFAELKYILVFLIFDIVIFAVIHLRKKSTKKEDKKGNVIIKHKKYLSRANTTKSSISLFGKLKVYNVQGEDISYKFSPILREILFLLICHTKQNGISSEKMKELLWLDKTDHSATNNRSVYFNRLRAIMKDVGDFKLISNNGFWKIETSIVVDYFSFLEIINKRVISQDDIITLLGILENGKFLSEFEEQWADSIKSDISDSIISILSNYLTGFNIKADSDFVIQICDAIFNFDSLNEIALNFKCKAYKEKGNHALAKLIYNNYSKDYLSLYGEEYAKSFSDIFYL